MVSQTCIASLLSQSLGFVPCTARRGARQSLRTRQPPPKMMLAGPKSYYDDYVRKQGTGRTLNDPPSLLTDRGAYVNFLEVQLERVSAACLGVNAYDQRFNDMQALIVSLEQRCAATTRLVGLAQQCTEEVRLETDNKIESVARDAREDHASVNVMFQAMSSRVSAAEQAISNLAAMVGRIEALEHRAAEMDGTLRAQQLAREEERLGANVRLEELESFKRNANDAIQKLQTEVSKQGLDIEENNKRASVGLMSIEERVTTLQARHKEEISEKIQESTSRISERLQESHSKLSAEQISLMNDLEAQRKESARRAELIEKSLPRAYNDAIMNAAKTACEIYRAEAEVERQAIEDEIDLLQQSLQSQQSQLQTLEDEARNQFQVIDRGLGEFTETAQMAQRRAASALQEAMAATMAVQRASSDGLLVTGALMRQTPALAEAAPATAHAPAPAPVHAPVSGTIPAPTRSASPTVRGGSPAHSHLQQQHQEQEQEQEQVRHKSPTPISVTVAMQRSQSAGDGRPRSSSPRASSPRATSPTYSRRDQELSDTFRSRIISPFFSRVPAKDRAVPLWFPTKNVSSRQAAATQMAERARRVAARQQAAMTKAVEPHVDTVHPAPRFTDFLPDVTSRAPLRQRAAQMAGVRGGGGGGGGPRSTQEIVASMMRQHAVSDSDDLVSIASTDSLIPPPAPVFRAAVAPRDHLRGAGARLAGRR